MPEPSSSKAPLRAVSFTPPETASSKVLQASSSKIPQAASSKTTHKKDRKRANLSNVEHHSDIEIDAGL